MMSIRDDDVAPKVKKLYKALLDSQTGEVTELTVAGCGFSPLQTTQLFLESNILTITPQQNYKFQFDATRAAQEVISSYVALKS